MDESTPGYEAGAGLIDHDPWLEPFAGELRARHAWYQDTRRKIVADAGSLAAFARAYEYLGFTRGEHEGRPGVWYREWAPRAIALALTGDFNDWDRMSHPMTRTADGVWSIFLPDEEYADRLRHGTRVKVHVHGAAGPRDRIPAMIRRAVFDEKTRDFAGQYWRPPVAHAWRHETPEAECGLRIYEAHVGMAQEEERVGTFIEFAEEILPRIKAAGYNAVQLMAIQEHPYYGSFGYQVSNFFAVSSRLGTPEELKALIDEAHGYGLLVFLDLVHSHAVKNLNEGLNQFDGSDHQYFHGGNRGQHPAWDSLCFDYGRVDVLRFLLSNVRYWLEEYRFDGFRFDGVKSMMYRDHGLGRHFTDYAQYFPPHVDEDGIPYLHLANELVHELRPDAITIAEDMSGMVGLARPIDEGGLGFDYRLAMGIPDYWIKLLKERTDEQWHMGEIFHTLSNRRAREKHVAYAESHDQAMVGDKTIAMWLLDADIYWNMNKGKPHVVIDRGMALHKMIRLITFLIGGEGYLNFMGNEFGHPEWIDFPREGNDWSYHFARRQWSLVDNPLLRYHALGDFDRAMQMLDSEFGVLSSPAAELIHMHEDNKVLVCHRGPLLCAFNFHPQQSLPDYRVGTPAAADYRLVLDTDAPQYGGHDQLVAGQVHLCDGQPWDEREQSIQLYLPARTGLVLTRI